MRFPFKSNVHIAQTQRLRIRRLCLADADDYFAIFGDSSVCRFEDFEPVSRDRAGEEVERIVEAYDSVEDLREYAVEHRIDRRVIGVVCCSLERGAVYVGFHFNPGYGRQGYATEAMQAFLVWLEETFQRPLRALVDPANAPSIALLGRLGFRWVGEHGIRVGGEAKREAEYRLDRKTRTDRAPASARAD